MTEDLALFLTASGLLAAVLAIWMRYWFEVGDHRFRTGLVGVVWCSVAVLVLLAGIGLASYQSISSRVNGGVSEHAISLFFAGLLMTGDAVGQTLFNGLVNTFFWVKKQPERIGRPPLEQPDNGHEEVAYVLYVLLCGGLLGWLSYSLSRPGFTISSWVTCYLVFFLAGLNLATMPILFVWQRKVWHKRETRASYAKTLNVLESLDKSPIVEVMSLYERASGPDHSSWE